MTTKKRIVEIHFLEKENSLRFGSTNSLLDSPTMFLVSIGPTGCNDLKALPYPTALRRRRVEAF